jgi:hypothetical protein
LSSQVIGLIETDAADAAVIFRELPPGRLPSNRSRRLGDLYTRRWPLGGEVNAESFDCQFECVAADIDRLRTDLEAEFAGIVTRFFR